MESAIKKTSSLTITSPTKKEDNISSTSHSTTPVTLSKWFYDYFHLDKVRYGDNRNDIHYINLNQQIILINEALLENPQKKISLLLLIVKSIKLSDDELSNELKKLKIKDLNINVFVREIRYYQPHKFSTSIEPTKSIIRILENLGYTTSLDPLFKAVQEEDKENIIKILKNTKEKLDLSYLLISVNLSSRDLRNMEFNNTNLSKADLSFTKSRGIDIINCDLTDSNLSGADFSGTNFATSNLTGANLSGTDFYGANFFGVILDFKKMSIDSISTLYKQLDFIKNFPRQYRDKILELYPEDSASETKSIRTDSSESVLLTMQEHSLH